LKNRQHHQFKKYLSLFTAILYLIISCIPVQIFAANTSGGNEYIEKLARNLSDINQALTSNEKENLSLIRQKALDMVSSTSGEYTDVWKDILESSDTITVIRSDENGKEIYVQKPLNLTTQEAVNITGVADKNALQQLIKNIIADIISIQYSGGNYEKIKNDLLDVKDKYKPIFDAIKQNAQGVPGIQDISSETFFKYCYDMMNWVIENFDPYHDPDLIDVANRQPNVIEDYLKGYIKSTSYGMLYSKDAKYENLGKLFDAAGICPEAIVDRTKAFIDAAKGTIDCYPEYLLALGALRVKTKLYESDGTTAVSSPIVINGGEEKTLTYKVITKFKNYSYELTSINDIPPTVIDAVAVSKDASGVMPVEVTRNPQTGDLQIKNKANTFGESTVYVYRKVFDSNNKPVNDAYLTDWILKFDVVVRDVTPTTTPGSATFRFSDITASKGENIEIPVYADFSGKGFRLRLTYPASSLKITGLDSVHEKLWFIDKDTIIDNANGVLDIFAASNDASVINSSLNGDPLFTIQAKVAEDASGTITVSVDKSVVEAADKDNKPLNVVIPDGFTITVTGLAKFDIPTIEVVKGEKAEIPVYAEFNGKGFRLKFTFNKDKFRVDKLDSDYEHLWFIAEDVVIDNTKGVVDIFAASDNAEPIISTLDGQPLFKIIGTVSESAQIGEYITFTVDKNVVEAADANNKPLYVDIKDSYNVIKVVSGVTPTPTPTPEYGTATFNIPAIEAEAGDEIDIPVYADFSGKGFRLRFTYPSSDLTVNDLTSVHENLWFIEKDLVIDNANGVLDIFAASNDAAVINSSLDGDPLFTIKAKISENATGTITLTVDKNVVQASDANNNPLTVVIADSYTITIVVKVTGVKLDKHEMELTEGGEPGTLTATVEPENATNKNVTWSSSNPEVATVDNGVVTPLKEGTAVITVTTVDGEFTDSCNVTVKKAPVTEVKVTGVKLDKHEMELIAGGEAGKLTATVEPENATNKSVTWSTSDAAVATVDNGVVTPLKAGTAVITVTTVDGGFTDKCTVTVKSPSTVIKVTGVRLDKNELKLIEDGFSKQLKAEVLPENATNKNVIWSSEDDDIATVDKDGWVTPVSVGKTIITVTTVDGGFTDTCVVRVVEDDDSKSTPTRRKNTSSSSTSITITPTVINFIDIQNHWAKVYIEELVRRGAISGYPDGTFKPDNNITRAEFATILVRSLKLTVQSGKVFNDTAYHWAKDYISTAYAAGIIQGYDNDTFGPDDLITREQMAVMVARAFKLASADTELSFWDKNDISSWAVEAIKSCVRDGIINGYPDGSFVPKGYATRAEAAKVIVKALELRGY